MSSTTGTTSGTASEVSGGGTVNPISAVASAATRAAIGAAGTEVKTEETKVVGFFEAHPKAIAIGASIAGAMAVLIVQHFI